MPWGDKSILDELLRQTSRIRDPHIRNVIERAGAQTGLVESGGRNLNHGDSDSLGWRQERKSIYDDPRNVKASIARFISEAQQHYKPGIKSYELAADVQRPAAQFRGRYQDVAKEAAQLLRGEGGARGGSQGSPQLDAGSLPSATTPQGSAGLLPLMQALSASQGPSQPASAGVPAPSFSARPVLAGQQVAPSSGGPVSSRPSIQALLAAAQATGAVPQVNAGSAPTVTGGGGGGLPSAPQNGDVRFSISPSANRAGVPLHENVIDFARAVGQRAGRNVKIGTGTNHSQMTVSGNVSDHWGGGAADIPASGNRLVALGRAALIQAGMDPKRARKQTGGLFNVTRHGVRYQIIFNTQEGGDHTDHLHVGLRKA